MMGERTVMQEALFYGFSAEQQPASADHSSMRTLTIEHEHHPIRPHPPTVQGLRQGRRLQRIGAATGSYVSSRNRATRPLRAGNLLAHRVEQPCDRAAVALDRRGKVRAVGCA